MVKLPKNFLPNKSLVKKISQILQKKAKGKERLLLDTHKRKVIIDTSTPRNMEKDIIYVKFDPNSDFINQGYLYRLDIISNQDFYFPVSENKIDWGSRIRKSGVAPLSTEESLLNYIKLLQENNDAVISWQNDDDGIFYLEQKFEETYNNEEKKEY